MINAIEFALKAFHPVWSWDDEGKHLMFEPFGNVPAEQLSMFQLFDLPGTAEEMVNLYNLGLRLIAAFQYHVFMLSSRSVVISDSSIARLYIQGEYDLNDKTADGNADSIMVTINELNTYVEMIMDEWHKSSEFENDIRREIEYARTNIISALYMKEMANLIITGTRKEDLITGNFFKRYCVPTWSSVSGRHDLLFTPYPKFPKYCGLGNIMQSIDRLDRKDARIYNVTEFTTMTSMALFQFILNDSRSTQQIRSATILYGSGNDDMSRAQLAEELSTQCQKIVSENLPEIYDLIFEITPDKHNEIMSKFGELMGFDNPEVTVDC